MAQGGQIPRCGDVLSRSAADVVAAHKKNSQVFVVFVKEMAALKMAPTSDFLEGYKIPTVCFTDKGFFAVSLGRKNIPMIATQSGTTFYLVSHLVSVGKFRGWVPHDDVKEYGVLSREELKTIESYAGP
jgi:hypothetical protein